MECCPRAWTTVRNSHRLARAPRPVSCFNSSGLPHKPSLTGSSRPRPATVLRSHWRSGLSFSKISSFGRLDMRSGNCTPRPGPLMLLFHRCARLSRLASIVLCGPPTPPSSPRNAAENTHSRQKTNWPIVRAKITPHCGSLHRAHGLVTRFILLVSLPSLAIL